MTPSTDLSTTTNEVYIDIQSKLQELQSQLLTAHPALPSLLRTIHSQLKNDPAVVTLLTEDEMHIIVQGLEKQTNTYLASSITKPSATKKASLSKVKVDDLF